MHIQLSSADAVVPALSATLGALNLLNSKHSSLVIPRRRNEDLPCYREDFQDAEIGYFSHR